MEYEITFGAWVVCDEPPCALGILRFHEGVFRVDPGVHHWNPRGHSGREMCERCFLIRRRGEL